MKEFIKLTDENFVNQELQEYPGKFLVFFQQIGVLIVFLFSTIGKNMEK